MERLSERATSADGSADGSRTVTLTFPAKPEYVALSRLALTGLARARPFADDTLADLKLALTEATSNSVRHAYADGDGHVQIGFELHGDRLIVEVSDDGPGFEQQASEIRAATNGVDAEDLSEGGLGIAIIRSLVDQLELGTGPKGGSRVRFVKLL